MMHELKLIKIHRRNLEILGEQKAMLGEFLPVHLQNQIDFGIKAIAEIEKNLKRRLQILLEKSATYGLNTPPEVSIEIEDIQAYFKEQETKNDTLQ